MRPATKYWRIMSSTTSFRNLPFATNPVNDQHPLPSLLRNYSRYPAAQDRDVTGSHPLSFPKWNTAWLSLRWYTELGSNFWFACPIPRSVVSAVYTVPWNDWVQLLLSPIHFPRTTESPPHDTPIMHTTMIPLPTSAFQFIYKAVLLWCNGSTFKVVSLKISQRTWARIWTCLEIER